MYNSYHLARSILCLYRIIWCTGYLGGWWFSWTHFCL